MAFTTLISTAALTLHLDDDAFAIVDCRTKLDDEGWGAREYRTAHIPGAVYADLNRDLSAPKTGTNGRHPRPDPDTLAARLGQLGIASGVQVVAYDQDNGMFASRLWWLLRWLGHDAVAVLDGGLAKWIAEGRPTASGETPRAAVHFTAAPRPQMTADVATVASRIGSRDWRLVDARAPERFRGEVEPLDRVPGHIPGAVNHFFQTNVENGVFKTPEELRASFATTLGGTPPDRVVCYCGSGVTACHNLLAMEHAGLTGAQLYVGSWSEWSSDPARPVEKA
ncbi:MAG TPA: sulfurtransferase [Vicinamibacterales bacterium]|nr:sulfurtransferase [Vicinamibacterales bacterium]